MHTNRHPGAGQACDLGGCRSPVYRGTNDERAFTVFDALIEVDVFGDLWRFGRRTNGSPDRPHLGVLAMLHFLRRSLLVQLVSVYLLFVVVVLIGGVEVNAVVEQQLRADVQASDQALAQEIRSEE